MTLPTESALKVRYFRAMSPSAKVCEASLIELMLQPSLPNRNRLMEQLNRSDRIANRLSIPAM